MDGVIILIVLMLLAIVLLPVVAIVKANAAESDAAKLAERVLALEREVRDLRRGEGRFATAPKAEGIPENRGAPSPVPDVASLAAVKPVPPKPAVPEPPPVPIKPPPQAVPPPVPAAPPPIDWEQLMGAKFFAWIGGLALFLGIGFFVKYSFDHNLVPPEVRVAIGFLAGIGLLVGGVLLKRRENAVTAQTLCATGVLVLYAMVYACHSYYRFPFFGPARSFLLMALVTAVAFVLSVRMNAMVIAILGIAGGFLTPVLLSTGQADPVAFFGYIALLDAGLLAVALRQRWGVLPLLGGAGTVAMQVSWMERFFVAERYFADSRVLIVMAVFAAMQALFLGAVAFAGRTGRRIPGLSASALLVAGAALASAFYFLSFPALAERPPLLFGYLFSIALGLIALAEADPDLAPAGALSGGASFIFLGSWTWEYLRPANLGTALAFYFLFALFHTALPLALARLRGRAAPAWCHLFPALSLVLLLMPVLQLKGAPILIWPAVLLVDGVAFAAAVLTGLLLPILAVLVLTLATLGAWIFTMPAELAGLPGSLGVLGGFALFFFAGSIWAGRRMAGTAGRAPALFGSPAEAANLSVQLPALSAVMPFLLLIMVTLQLPLADPSQVFGLALALVFLLLGLARVLKLDLLPAVALVSAGLLEYAWHMRHFDAARAARPLEWYLGFHLVFTAFPFLFRRSFEDRSSPWGAAAMSGPVHFYLVYTLLRAAHPGIVRGLIPAAFAIVPLLGLALLAGNRGPARNSQLAFFGGVALLFITLIFPIQFHRQWITVGWALEGAALCWLFHRVPHSGLRLTGVALVAAAFVRLALNPYVLEYHARATHPVLNWYLYSYGIVTACLFLAARLLAPPRDRVLGHGVLPLLCTLGTVLAFLLVNIEIADCFCPPGTLALTFEFSGNFARDMSYSIAWALFALLLLIVGIQRKVAAVRYGGLSLLGVTVLKLFFHDLSQLDQLYRIGAFIAVAVIAMLASFLYQRFLGASRENKEAGLPRV